MKAPKAQAHNGYVSYLTRKMPVRLHREMGRLAEHLHMTLQGVHHCALDLGLTYMLRTHGLTPLGPQVERPIDWSTIDEGTGGEVHAA